jgi:hypothetical protein
MQKNSKEYNPRTDTRYKGIRVIQPYADAIAEGKQSRIIMSKPTKYRGEVLIVSGGRSDYDTRQGMTICVVDLCRVAPVAAMTQTDRAKSGYADDVVLQGYCYQVKNPRKVVEIPASGHQGLFNIVFAKDDIVVYPKIQIRKKAKGLLSLFKNWR